MKVWEAWHRGGLGIAAICEQRHIKQSTALSYLAVALESGEEYFWHRLGVPCEVELAVRDAVAALRRQKAEAAAAPVVAALVANNAPAAHNEAAAAAVTVTAVEVPRAGEVRQLMSSELGAEWWMLRMTLMHLRRTGG